MKHENGTGNEPYDAWDGYDEYALEAAVLDFKGSDEECVRQVLNALHRKRIWKEAEHGQETRPASH